MPLDRLSLHSLTLALLALPALLICGVPVGAQEATPAAGTGRYVSEELGYAVNWSSDWTQLKAEPDSDGFGMVTLIQDDTMALIVFSRPGDTPLGEIAEILATGPSPPFFVPTAIVTAGTTQDRAWEGLYAGDGLTEFHYGEVRRLEANLTVGLSLTMPAGDFDGGIAPYSSLLDGVTKIDPSSEPPVGNSSTG